MAKFSSTFLQGLLQPAYQEGLFEAAKGAGQTPGIMALEQNRLKEGELLDKMITTSSQGIAGAQQGDVSAVTRQIGELRKLMAGPDVTLDQKREFAGQIQQLQKLIPGAQKTATTNKAQAIIRAEEALENPALDTTVREVLEQRIAEMKKDPDAFEQYNEYRINRWRTDKAQQEMEGEAWVQSNSGAIVKAIQEADLDKLDDLGTQAADKNSYAAFQKYVDTTTQNVKTRDYLEQRSTERTNAPNLNYDEAIDQLPTEKMKNTVRARYNAYKEAVDQGWNEETKTWNEALRTRANVLEKALKDSLYRMQDAVAIADFRDTNALETAQRELIQKLELNFERPVDEINVARIAKANAKDPDDITSAEYDAAREEEKRRNRRSLIDQITIIDPEYAKEKYPPREITEDISMYSETEQAIIRDAAQEYPDRKVEDIILALRRKRYIGNKSSSDGAFGGEYMSSEHLKAEQSYLESVRSKISPLGTYTQG